ncbi:hypothetical protein AgCh_036396 [Apium graveolens]
MAEPMRLKFSKYWDECDPCLAIAVILDPRFKMDIIEYYYDKFYGSELSFTHVERVRKSFFDLYIDKLNDFKKWKQREKSSGNRYVPKSEFDQYLEEETHPTMGKFNILTWWSINGSRFPTISKIARDVLVVPATTVASEAAFSVWGRVIDETCSCLLPKAVEVLITTSDWILSRKSKFDRSTAKLKSLTGLSFLSMYVKLRFLMMIANHLSEDIVLENPTNKLDCWVQERRIIADVNRANHQKEVSLFYFPVMEAPQVSEVSSDVPTLPASQISLPYCVALATVSMTQQLPTQATKPSKISKSKSKKAPSGISQKMPVAKSTKLKEGSVKVGREGEGQSEHQRNPKDKVGEVSVSRPSHTAVSQQTVVLNKDISSLLVASSQKDVTIEQSSQPRAQAKRVRDTSSPQTYTRKKKPKTLGDAQGSHTVQTGAEDTVTAPFQIQFDVAPINVESRPKSLVIEAPQTPNSPTNSLDVDMINTSIPDSPYLTLLGKPKSSASEHHLLDDLLAHLPILSGTVETSVPKFSSICTESTIVSTPNTFISTHSMDTAYPSSSDCIPTDKLNSSYPSDSQTANPTDIPYRSSVSAQLQISSIISSA